MLLFIASVSLCDNKRMTQRVALSRKLSQTCNYRGDTLVLLLLDRYLLLSFTSKIMTFYRSRVAFVVIMRVYGHFLQETLSPTRKKPAIN